MAAKIDTKKLREEISNSYEIEMKKKAVDLAVNILQQKTK